MHLSFYHNITVRSYGKGVAGRGNSKGKGPEDESSYSGLTHPPALTSFLPLFIHIWLSKVALKLLNAAMRRNFRMIQCPDFIYRGGKRGQRARSQCHFSVERRASFQVLAFRPLSACVQLRVAAGACGWKV